MRFFEDITVEPIAFFTMFAVSMEYAVMQDMLFTKICMNTINTTNPHLCVKSMLSNETKEEVSRQQALHIRYYLALLYFPAILTTLYSGAWSDYFGRKKPMSMPFVFSILAQISFIICSVFIEENLIGLIFLSGFLSGISGGVTNVLANAFGYISDITTSDNRTNRITLLEAMFYIGGFLGFYAAGALMQHLIGLHYEIAFIITLSIYIIILLYIAVRVKEVREQREWTFASVVSCSHVVNVFKTVFRKRTPRWKRKSLILLIVCSAISILAQTVLTSLLFSYVSKPPLNWDRSLYSYYNAFSYAVNGASLVIILPSLLKLCQGNLTDTMIGFLGFLSKAVGLYALGLSNTTELMFLCPLLLVFHEFTMPAVRSIVSKLVGESEKGKAFAILASMQNVLQFFGSLVFTSLFSATIKHFPGFPFEVAGCLQVVAMLIFLYLHLSKKPEEEESIIETT